MPDLHNLIDELPDALPDELTEVLLRGEGAYRLERIVSFGQASPPGFWYDQHQDEWVLLLSGSAELVFESEDEPVALKPGDHLLIPAHRRHRVASTAAGTHTVWLALFFNGK